MLEPKVVMQRLYDYLEEPYFEHDFNHIEQRVTENDSVHGVYGDHAVRAQLAPLAPDWDAVLGADISSRIATEHDWFYQTFYRGRAPVT